MLLNKIDSLYKPARPDIIRQGYKFTWILAMILLASCAGEVPAQVNSAEAAMPPDQPAAAAPAEALTPWPTTAVQHVESPRANLIQGCSYASFGQIRPLGAQDLEGVAEMESRGGATEIPLGSEMQIGFDPKVPGSEKYAVRFWTDGISVRDLGIWHEVQQGAGYKLKKQYSPDEVVKLGQQFIIESENRECQFYVMAEWTPEGQRFLLSRIEQ